MTAVEQSTVMVEQQAGKPLALFSQWPHLTYRLDHFDLAGYGTVDEDRTPRPFMESNVTTSEISEGHPLSGRHTLVLDLDVPAVLVPSSTPGHSHLYVDVSMEWEQLQSILEALDAGGVIEHGYAGASIARGHTSLRMPWIRKAPISPGGVSSDIDAPF